MIDVEQLNTWSPAEAQAAFLRCCGAVRWAGQMTARRPYRDEHELLDAAAEIWQGLGPDDWLQAFAAHPRIGDVEGLRAKFAATAAWSKAEQAGMAGATEDVLRALAEGNRAYETKFGYIFIVCATGKSASEMLALLRDRLSHDPQEELRFAAGEQAKITRLRLQKLCS